jgi:hypothetical protein
MVNAGQFEHLEVPESFKRTSDTLQIDVNQLLPHNLCGNLLIYRGEHYCDNPQFMQNFSALYRMDDR